MSSSLYELPCVRTVQTVKDVSAQSFIEAFAKYLKKSNKITVPVWTTYCKTSCTREQSPLDADWVYYRAAAIARRVYIRGNVGVGGFSKCFGDKARRGHLPNKYQKASTKIIRHLLQELERNNFIEKSEDKKGRRITKTGQREMDTIAVQVTA